jgi:hypothetical protein
VEEKEKKKNKDGGLGRLDLRERMYLNRKK